MRQGVETPTSLVDVSRLNEGIELFDNDVLRVGAGTRNTVLAEHPVVRSKYPALSRAILTGASGQIRNMATVGGNILQRTRCAYFYDVAARCNKRRAGEGCDAIGGFNRNHGILGTSPSCVATHPSDMCVALSVFDAEVELMSTYGARRLALTDLHRMPGDRPDIETQLQQGELITAIELPAVSSEMRSAYRKVRDRSSYAFALASVAIALQAADDGTLQDIRISLGGVAPKPWRARIAEQALMGARMDPNTIRRAAERELAQANALRDNAFKVELASRLISVVLRDLLEEKL